MATNLSIDFLNTDFEVGDSLSGEDASPHSIAVPQFSSDLDDLSDFLPDAPVDLHPATPHLPAKPSPNPWPPQLVVELALGIDDEDTILDRHNVARTQYERLLQIPAFRRELATTMRDLWENGVTFTRKAAIQAEGYLVDLDDIVKDPEVNAGTRLAAIASAVRWGKLEPKEDKTQENNATTVNLQINFT